MESIQGNVNWGIIGCGDVCEIKSGPAFNKVSNSRLIAVMRRDLAKAEDYARRHQVQRFYDDASELINDEDVNAIYIATPPSSHEIYLEQALHAGKPVYVEKPVTIDSASCERMITYARKYSNKVCVAHYRRELSLFKKIKAVINDGIIGKVRHVQMKTWQPLSDKHNTRSADNWRVIPEISGGGIFHDLSPHQLDIMFWLFGRPKKIQGFALNQSNLYPAPDNTMIQALFADNISFNGVWAFNVAPAAAQEKCEIIGDTGKLSFAFFKLGALELTTGQDVTTIPMEYPVNIQHPMIEAVTKYFRGEGPNPCSLEDALEVMKMIDSPTAVTNVGN